MVRDDTRWTNYIDIVLHRWRPQHHPTRTWPSRSYSRAGRTCRNNYSLAAHALLADNIHDHCAGDVMRLRRSRNESECVFTSATGVLLCVCECTYVLEREWERKCVYLLECACVWEKEGEMCIYVREETCVYVCVCEREKESWSHLVPSLSPWPSRRHVPHLTVDRDSCWYRSPTDQTRGVARYWRQLSSSRNTTAARKC